jgi:hypothetical protein
MKVRKWMALLVLFYLALVFTSGTVPAQERGAGAYYQGTSRNTPRCPAIRYLFRALSATPVGYVWFADASGMSKATGTLDLQSGVFHLTLTSLDGNGPTGEVTGRKDLSTGVVTAELQGPACSKLKLGPINPYFRKADGRD